MNSGLDWEEEYFNISDATKMLYLESDMGQVQIKNQLVGEPDQLWNYSSGTTNILSGPLLRKEFDSLGEVLVPADKYWGASTQRSNKYFDIGD